jgi:hypothetical protein
MRNYFAAKFKILLIILLISWPIILFVLYTTNLTSSFLKLITSFGK